MVLGTLPDLLMAPFAALTSSKKVIAGPHQRARRRPALPRKLAESGELRPVIDRRYAFHQIAQAHRHVDAGHKRESVVVTVT